MPTAVDPAGDRRLRWLDAALLVGGLIVLAASWLLHPAGPTDVALFGRPLGLHCSMQQVFHLPCWSCGSTRAFVHAARLRFAEAWAYNPPAVLIFVYVVLQLPFRTVRLAWPGLLPRRWAFEFGVPVSLLVIVFVHWIWRVACLLGAG